MSKFVSYTCNKKGEPTMREECKTCPEYIPCGKEGQWCLVGALVVETERVVAKADVKAMGDMTVLPCLLENPDPSLHYKGTTFEGLDAFQRQLKRFDIKGR